MTEGKDNVTPKVLSWKCPKCGKQINSIYPGQFVFLQKQHNLTHDKEKKTL